MNFNEYIPPKYDDDGQLSQAYLDYLDWLDSKETLAEREYERKKDEGIYND